MVIIDGQVVSQTIQAEIKAEIQKLLANNKRPPHLAAILVGDNPASQTYVNAKINACSNVGFVSSLLKFDATISEEFLIQQIEKLNEDNGVDGFIVQLPLPKHISQNKVIEAINPNKDVDGFHPVNMGKMVLGLKGFLPATPAGILELLKRYHIETKGKNCVVIGRSNIVGKPISILLSQNTYPGNCTVTLCHSSTNNLQAICQQADIIIAAIGVPKFLTANMIKEGTVVIDVGINRIEDTTKKSGYRLVGDVDFENVAPKCSFITPVPKGVGPMTIAALLQNTLLAYQAKNG